VLSSRGTSVEYSEYLDVPGWTMSSDRFWFLKGTVERTDPSIIFHWERLIDGGAHAARYAAVKAAHESAIEPPINVGAWTFTTTATGSEVKYYVCTDAGGSIPMAVQTAATRRTLPDTVGDLVREGRRRSQ
jgi:hypothetical protein